MPRQIGEPAETCLTQGLGLAADLLRKFQWNASHNVQPLDRGGDGKSCGMPNCAAKPSSGQIKAPIPPELSWPPELVRQDYRARDWQMVFRKGTPITLG